MPQNKNAPDAEKLNQALEKIQKFQDTPYSKLSVEKRIKLVTLNKTIKDLIWGCYTKSAKQKDSLQAAQYFLIALERHLSEAENAYNQSQTGKTGEEELVTLTQVSTHEYVLQGLQYMLGINISQNASIAIQYFQKAIEMGDARGAYFIGLALESGTAIEKSMERAIGCYQYAAQQGYALAQYKLATIQKEKGEHTEAALSYTMAAEQGEPYAQRFLAEAYQTGTGVPQNEDEALKWHLLALEGGNHPNIDFALGNLSSLLAQYTKLTLRSPWWGPEGEKINKGVILLLNNPELQQQFIAEELHRSNTYMRGYYQLEIIISLLISEAKQRSLNIDAFLTDILLTISKIPDFERIYLDNPALKIKTKLINAIDLSQTQASQLIELLEYITSILVASFKNYEDFERFICLWYRAQSLEVEVNNPPLLRKILCMIVNALCNENHALKIASVPEFHINLLIPFLKAEKKLTIKEINQVLGTTIVVTTDSMEAPVQILRGLKKFMDDFDPKKNQNIVYFYALNKALHSSLPFEELDNYKAINCLEELSQLSRDLKRQPQLHSLFKIRLCPLGQLAKILIDLDVPKLIQFINKGKNPYYCLAGQLDGQVQCKL